MAGRNPEADEKIIELYLDHTSYEEMAEQMGVESPGTVYRRLARLAKEGRIEFPRKGNGKTIVVAPEED